jgi:hypothetical protein
MSGTHEASSKATAKVPQQKQLRFSSIDRLDLRSTFIDMRHRQFIASQPPGKQLESQPSWISTEETYRLSRGRRPALTDQRAT